MADRYLGEEEVNRIKDCLTTIQKSLDRIEMLNHNGGLNDLVDTEEVDLWQKRALTGSLAKSKLV